MSKTHILNLGDHSNMPPEVNREGPCPMDEIDDENPWRDRELKYITIEGKLVMPLMWPLELTIEASFFNGTKPMWASDQHRLTLKILENAEIEVNPTCMGVLNNGMFILVHHTCCDGKHENRWSQEMQNEAQNLPPIYYSQMTHSWLPEDKEDFQVNPKVQIFTRGSFLFEICQSLTQGFIGIPFPYVWSPVERQTLKQQYIKKIKNGDLLVTRSNGLSLCDMKKSKEADFERARLYCTRLYDIKKLKITKFRIREIKHLDLETRIHEELAEL